MSHFTYSDYNSVVERAQSGTSSTKIGFFKLPDDGDEAIVRINCASVNSLEFATVHTVQVGGRWMRVSCLNPVGSYNHDDCELCRLAEEEGSNVSKAGKKVYLQMIVSYKDRASGQWSAPQPVIWERPAGFSREIATFLSNYGDLRQQLIKITRNGKARDMKTTYSMLPAPTTVFKSEMIPMDFSAFDNFRISKHSYWEKTADEIHEFVVTGAFPEPIRQNQGEQPVAQPAVESHQPVNAYNQTPVYQQPAQPVQPTVQPVPQPVEQPTPAPAVDSVPSRNFGGTGRKFQF